MKEEAPLCLALYYQQTEVKFSDSQSFEAIPRASKLNNPGILQDL